MTAAFIEEGLSLDEARRRLWFVDVNGLVVKGRTDLMAHNLPYAHDFKPLGFVDAIDAIRPHVLIGATGAPATFTRAVDRADEQHQPATGDLRALKPDIAGRMHGRTGVPWSSGRAVFASGSPFEPVGL